MPHTPASTVLRYSSDFSSNGTVFSCFTGSMWRPHHLLWKKSLLLRRYYRIGWAQAWKNRSSLSFCFGYIWVDFHRLPPLALWRGIICTIEHSWLVGYHRFMISARRFCIQRTVTWARALVAFAWVVLELGARYLDLGVVSRDFAEGIRQSF